MTIDDAILRDIHASAYYGVKRRCGAHARTTGRACKAPARENGRCNLHGGLSTGPKTREGRKRIANAQRKRWTEWRCERGI